MKRSINIILCAIVSLMVLPQTANGACRGEKKEEKTAIVAHRGFWNCEEGGYSKNSVAALKAAQDNGFWGSEFDVNMTKDGVLLVWHDGKVGDKIIEKHNHADFKDVRLKNGEPIPTIDDYLTQALEKPSTVLVYELKKHSCPEFEDLVVDMSIRKLKEYGLYNPKNVIFISFSFHMCYKLSQEAPEFTVQYLGSDRAPEELARFGIKGLDYQFNAFRKNPTWSKTARALGMSTNSWTVNQNEDISFIIGEGIGTITSDYPVRVREMLSEKGVKERRAK